MSNQTPKSILCVQLKHIGDVLVTLPSLALIKKHLPLVKLGLVVTKDVALLLQGHSLIDDIFVYPAEKNHLAAAWSLACQVRKKKYEMALFFDAKRRSGLIGLLAGIHVRLSSNAMGSIWPWPKSLAFTKQICLDWHSGENVASRYQRFVSAAFGWPVNLSLDIAGAPLPPKALEQADLIWQEANANGPKIIFTMTGRQPAKDWPAENFAKLATLLYDNFQARLLVTGTANESFLAEKVQSMTSAPMRNLCGRSNLLELLAILKKSDLLISIDTGTAHLAAWLKMPQITIFLGSSPGQWAPLNFAKGLVLATDSLVAQEGAPAQLAWKSFPTIEAETVFAEAQKMLKL